MYGTNTQGVRKMTKKTYAITAYYKDYMLYQVEADSEEEAKKIALENQKDWERPDEFAEQDYFFPPVIEDVEEV
jgi:hypothetical protein